MDGLSVREVDGDGDGDGRSSRSRRYRGCVVCVVRYFWPAVGATVVGPWGADKKGRRLTGGGCVSTVSRGEGACLAVVGAD